MIDLHEGLRLAVDTGVLSLIWLVQLVIYPGLARYSEPELKSWHPIYTRNVTFVVLPLMFSQLGLSAFLALVERSVADIAHMSFVLIAWAITFFRAVPLHHSIDTSKEGNALAHQLINANKPRTVVWTAAWLVSLISILF